MAIGTVAAIALGIGSAANAGMQMYGAKKAADASRQAAQTQADSADRALAFQGEQMDRALAAYAPYMAMSQGAMGKLADLLGVKPVEMTQTPAAAAAQAGMGPSSTMPMSALLQPSSVMGTRTAQTRAPSNLPSGMVQMRAPDGEMRWVQPGAVAKYTARGAQLIG